MTSNFFRLSSLYCNSSLSFCSFSSNGVCFDGFLRIGDEHEEREYIIVDTEGQEIPTKSIETTKVCGIHYSYNGEAAYQLNITDKIGFDSLGGTII